MILNWPRFPFQQNTQEFRFGTNFTRPPTVKVHAHWDGTGRVRQSKPCWLVFGSFHLAERIAKKGLIFLFQIYFWYLLPAFPLCPTMICRHDILTSLIFGYFWPFPGGWAIQKFHPEISFQTVTREQNTKKNTTAFDEHDFLRRIYWTPKSFGYEPTEFDYGDQGSWNRALKHKELMLGFIPLGIH